MAASSRNRIQALKPGLDADQHKRKTERGVGYDERHVSERELEKMDEFNKQADPISTSGITMGMKIRRPMARWKGNR